MDLLVGAPVYKRAWAIPLWYEHLKNAVNHASEVDSTPLNFEIIFVTHPEDDLKRAINSIDVPVHIIRQEQDNPSELRNWGDPGRFEAMVMLRNRLLREVRILSPDLFLSLDSDILLHPQAVQNLVDTVVSYDAVGGKCYMQRVGTLCPSYAMIGPDNNLHRTDSSGVHPVDAIMAIKMMTEKAYWIDYEYHHNGEDIGWSKACKREGVTLGWDGRVCNKHVMLPELINKYDPRCGF